MTALAPAPPADDDVVDLRREEANTPEPVVLRPRRSPRRIAGLVLATIGCVIGAFLVFEFAATNLMYDRSQSLLLKDLRTVVGTQEATDLAWVPQEGEPVGVLTIPSIGLSSVIVQGSTAALTEQGPGHLRASPMPGRPGNAVILGRRTTYGSPFGHLDAVRPGDTVEVATGAGSFTYLVATVAVVEPGDADVIGWSNDSRLTLITSSPPYRATGRLVVTGVLNGLPAPQPPGEPVFVAPTELGLAGDMGALGGTLLWGELAIAAAVAAVWLSRRASKRVAWLLGAPLVLALVWATFASAGRFFPATL